MRKPNTKDEAENLEMNKSASKNTGRRRNNKRKPSNRTKDELKSSTNDLSWYSAGDPAIIRDAASFPFNRPAGMQVGYNFANNTYGSNKVTQGFAHQSFPGIARVVLAPSVGLSQDATSAVNVAAMSVYSFIRHANSGHANYDAPDLMMYLLGMSSVYGAINWLQRIYGTALMWSQENRFIPRYLLESDGIDFDDIVANLATFRYNINLLINKASAFAVPNTFKIFNRHAFLFQNYYIEGESVKDQIYYYAPSSFYHFKLDAQGKGMLALKTGIVRTSSNPIGYQTLTTYVSGMLDDMLNQEDFGIMSGDVLKAYGENIIKLQSLDEYYKLELIYDPTVLYQIKNATPMLWTGATMAATDIMQDANGVIKCTPYVTLANTDVDIIDIWTNSKPITADLTHVEAGDVVESTRLHMGLRQDPANTTHYLIVHGSEVVIQFQVFKMDFNGTPELIHFNIPYVDRVDISNPTDAMMAIAQASVLDFFKYHPGHYTTWLGGTNQWASTGLQLDVDNYAMVDVDEVSRVHDACLFNMLHVPAVGKENLRSK